MSPHTNLSDCTSHSVPLQSMTFDALLITPLLYTTKSCFDLLSFIRSLFFFFPPIFFVDTPSFISAAVTQFLLGDQ